MVCIRDVFTTYGSCLTFIWLTVVLCALHEPNYNFGYRHLVKQLL